MLAYMSDALRRGVTVRLLAPWTQEVTWTVPLMREYVRTVQRMGVQVRSAGEPLMHAKAFLIDGAWGVVGSANINHRSALFDRELSVIIGKGDDADQLKTIMEAWWNAGTPLTKEQLKQSMKEWVAAGITGKFKKFI